MQKPSNVQIAGALLLAGGIWSLLFALTATAFSFCIWVPSWAYSIAASIVAIVNGAKLLGDCQGKGVPKATAIMQVCQIVQLDVVGMVLGIVALVMLNDKESIAYLEGNTAAYAGTGYGYGGAQQMAPGPHAQHGHQGFGTPTQQQHQGFGTPTQQGHGAPPQPGWGHNTHQGAPQGGAPPPTPWGTPPAAPPPSPFAVGGPPQKDTQPGGPGSERAGESTQDEDSSWQPASASGGFAGRPGTGTAGDTLANNAFDDPAVADTSGAATVDDTDGSSLDRYRIAPWGAPEGAAPAKIERADTVPVVVGSGIGKKDDKSS